MKTTPANAIKGLLSEYLAAVAETVQSFQPLPRGDDADAKSVLFLEEPHPMRFAILERMIGVLGPAFEIPDARELEGVICERLNERLALTAPLQPPGIDDQVLDGLVADIQQPLREYAFSVECSGYGQMVYNIEFSGQPLVRLCAIQPDDGSGLWAHRIEGQIRAWTYEDAAARAETVLEEFLGACMTLGMTTTILRPRTIEASAQRAMVITPTPPSIALYLDLGLSTLTSSTVFQIPPDLTDLEERAFQRGDYGEATNRVVETLASLFSRSGHGAGSLRTALRFFCRGTTTREYGLAVFNWFTALEGLLLDNESKADVQSRIIEAVTFSLGTGVSDRAALRKELKRLYEDRSQFVHNGRVAERLGVRARCQELTRRVLRHELQCL